MYLVCSLWILSALYEYRLFFMYLVFLLCISSALCESRLFVVYLVCSLCISSVLGESRLFFMNLVCTLFISSVLSLLEFCFGCAARSHKYSTLFIFLSFATWPIIHKQFNCSKLFLVGTVLCLNSISKSMTMDIIVQWEAR